jgi:phosphatidylglycerophosphatase A
VETAGDLFGVLLAGYFGGWESVLVLAIILILLGARRLPELGQGIRQFRDAAKAVRDELQPSQDENALVYEALTHDNRTAEFIYPRRSDLSEALRAMILFLAQGFGVGRIRFAPGTWGSVVGLVWFEALLATTRLELYLLGAVGAVALSIWLCGAAEKILKQKDPSSVVLDEIVAIPFCFLPWITSVWLKTGKLPALETFFSGRSLLIVAAIFILFRLFDIWKPWPIRQSQRLPGGWGVTVDDLLAAGYVALLSLLFAR